MEISGHAIVKRIDTWLIEKNLKRQALAETIGITKQSFTDWDKRNSVPSADILYNISLFFNKPIQLLLTGEDPDSLSETERNIISKWREIDDVGKDSVMAQLDHFVQRSRQEKNKDISAG